VSTSASGADPPDDPDMDADSTVFRPPELVLCLQEVGYDMSPKKISKCHERITMEMKEDRNVKPKQIESKHSTLPDKIQQRKGDRKGPT